MNRKERRDQQKQQRRVDRQKRHDRPREFALSKEQMVAGMIRNGITVADLKREYEAGHSDGYSLGCQASVRTVYAAICLALNDLYGFGLKRCGDVLQAVDRHVVNTLASSEAIDEVYKRMKLSIEFDDPFERVVREE